MSVLNQAHFQDEAAAFAFVESIVWPDGPVCPNCGNKGEKGKIYELKGVRSKPSKKHPEGVERHGLKKCGNPACYKQFTVRMGTIFESSHLALHQWLQAFHLLCSSKKGISSNQLSRVLEVKLQTAWFVGHRIREAMRTGSLAPMGGPGSIVEADETFIGTKDGVKKFPWTRAYHHKQAMVRRDGERGSCKASDQASALRTCSSITNAVLYQEAGQVEMPKRKATGSNQERSQIDMFVEAARELECDDDEGQFRERFKKLTEAPAPETVQVRKLKLGLGGKRKRERSV